jgi:hypothetical protein
MEYDEKIIVFANNLLNSIIFATKEQQEKEHWNVSGILKKRSNQELKFDVRPMFNMPDGQLGKKGTTASKADKIVYETVSDWVIVDTEELHKYIKENKITVIPFETLISKLDWNILISKNENKRN